MTTRRDFCQWMAKTASLAMIPSVAAQASAVQASQEPAPAPSARHGRPLLELQQQFLDLRFGMFVHFNMATFQNREWGDPTSPADQFNPTALDTDQWAAAAKSANMTWGCLTTKHHDGFCIWPTATKSASVRLTQHKTDVVRAYVDSFRKANLRVALYFSILDMRDDIRHFNITHDKIQLVKDQLTELFTGYGAVDALIIDGWNAPWSRITYEEMPFTEIYEHIKSMQPDCLVSDLNASQFPAGGLYYSDLKAFEQNAGQKVPPGSDLPAFSCVTLTDGWFWKQSDANGRLKPTATVVDEWLVPLNRRHCNLILNAAPNREGRLAPNVVARLEEIGKAWQHPGPAEKISEHIVITTPNLATGKPIKASSYPDTVGPDLANDGDFRSSWNPDDGLTSAWLQVDLKKEQSFNVLSLVEPVGQWDDYKQSRIKSYKFQAWNGHDWTTLVEGGVPVPVAIHRIPRVTSSQVRLTIESGHDAPHIADLGVYNQ
ncbi:alpha-L-fucosidase [Acidicapsa acidisoli]|uniref:alpha-L-fucosidase n=1 Tax=Acidicapsa acidisoli TaxID=1615681 RepID=UPI0021DF8BA8|nr:alpha-L-fucosidase [Acidicapsa acidisoli]